MMEVWIGCYPEYIAKLFQMLVWLIVREMFYAL